VAKKKEAAHLKWTALGANRFFIDFLYSGLYSIYIVS
jgi:hypothetical protein